MRERGALVVTTREPGGTRLGELLRDLLLDPASKPVPLAELMLLEAARAQLVAQVVTPSLAAGRWVLSDRFSDSSRAYQGVGRGLGRDVVSKLNALACGTITPDRTVVLDLPVETALARARHRPSTTADNRRFEDEALTFHEAVARAYRELGRCEPLRVLVIDASGTPDEVHRRVLDALADLIP